MRLQFRSVHIVLQFYVLHIPIIECLIVISILYVARLYFMSGYMIVLVTTVTILTKYTLIQNMPPAGLEPATPRLEVWCSIHWATRALYKSMNNYLSYSVIHVVKLQRTKVIVVVYKWFTLMNAFFSVWMYLRVRILIFVKLDFLLRFLSRGFKFYFVFLWVSY